MRITCLPRYIDQRQILAVQINAAQPRDAPSPFGCFISGLFALGQRQSHASRCTILLATLLVRSARLAAQALAAAFPREPFRGGGRDAMQSATGI